MPLLERPSWNFSLTSKLFGSIFFVPKISQQKSLLCPGHCGWMGAAQASRCCHGCGDRSETQEMPEEIDAQPWSEDPEVEASRRVAGGGLHMRGAAVYPRPGHGRSLLDLLQGTWHRKEDGQPVGEISGTYIVWNPRWQFRDVISPISEDVSGAVVIDLDKQLHFGRPYFGPETLISWGDGDLWVKKSII